MKILLHVVALFTAFATAPLFGAGALEPQPPVELTGTPGRFDFIKIDSSRRRLLACHTGNGSLDIIDLATSKLIKSIPTGAAQGVAMDDKGGRYFVSCSKPPKLVIVDAMKLEITGEIALPGPADLVAYDPGQDRVYVDNDEKPEMWVIDPAQKKLLTTITLSGGGMEDLAILPGGHAVIQCLKDSSQLVKRDLTSGRTDMWSTLPAENPHGLALVDGTNAVLIAGGKGKLVLMDDATGEIIASTDIAQRVDEITYDPDLKRAYAASGLGTISVILVPGKKLAQRESVPSSPGAHSIAVDPQTHTVWTAYGNEKQAFIRAFTMHDLPPH